jgi:hypothetical protein
VGRESGTVLLTLGADGRVSRVGERGVEVSQTTLDELAEQYGLPDLIKMDIEGAELDALQGASNVLLHGPSLFIEVHSPDLVDRVAGLLDAAGYSVERGKLSSGPFMPIRLDARKQTRDLPRDVSDVPR